MLDLVWDSIWCYNIKGFVSGALCVRLHEIRDSIGTADIIYCNSNRSLRSTCQYIFPTLCIQKPNYTIYNKGIRGDGGLYMTICK